MSCCGENQERTDIPVNILAPKDKAIPKVILLGNSGVGKTSLITRLRDDRFEEGREKATIGCNYTLYQTKEDGTVKKIAIWDTAGQEIYNSLTTVFLRDAAIAIVCFSIVDILSYADLKKWIDKITDDKCQIILAGTKMDLKESSDYQVTKECIEVAYPNSIYIETSSATGEGVAELFEKVMVMLDCD